MTTGIVTNPESWFNEVQCRNIGQPILISWSKDEKKNNSVDDSFAVCVCALALPDVCLEVNSALEMAQSRNGTET